ncbi:MULTISPECIES: hypothetical protein [Bacillaceae]|uniref:Lipoprotein n=2 Tax=Bacillus infantis TaxID=324767 RepID=U5LC80_9BACI|nr:MULTISPECIES: hypothetical protein [Bacillus]OXT16433.1 hypothetical protein B9K06_16250 [Bacillus sp. OG2]AGX05033.1 hypothetical protein N288_15670 [Bacillus infantis NRRL B-14911]EAR66537.1 hypothetical protein B14911_23317 [Bacillus sp. NRRL B-14911]MCA1035423.1 hypothetical protein [Bacillus infantis]MCK6207533.1 hypothetical protein [Bacillus infantis]
MKKRAASILAILSIVLPLSACGTNNNQMNEPEEMNYTPMRNNGDGFDNDQVNQPNNDSNRVIPSRYVDPADMRQLDEQIEEQNESSEDWSDRGMRNDETPKTEDKPDLGGNLSGER